VASTPVPPPEDQEQTDQQGPQLTPIDLSQYNPLGKYSSFDVSPEPMFGPDELGEYKSAIDDLSETCTRADSSARNFEVLQAWEQRLFSRGYHFLNAGRGGWGLYGGVNGSRASGSEILQSQNAGRMFAVNVYGAREDKFVAALSRDIPGFTFVPKRDKDPMDQTAAEEAQKYLQVWLNDAGIKDVSTRIDSYFYTDDRVVLYTRSVADEQRWGTETPDEQQETFGDAVPEGVTPENELQPGQPASEVPAVREITTAFGKLEAKVPIYADDMAEMPWVRISTEQNVNTLKERYPWIEEKIKAGGAGSKNGGGADQLDRQARINVRLAVQSSTSSGESWQQDATETLTWYRPSQYRSIKQKELRQLFYQNFPDGLLAVHAGGELAFIRNESLNDHLTVLHAKQGSGQNRRSVGANFLPIQKTLNARVSLDDRYTRGAVARRYALEGPIDVQALNQQSNDPAKVTPVLASSLPANMTLDNIIAVEKTPQPNSTMQESMVWMATEAPELMDGMSPAMFGMEDADTFGATKLNRDQALQVLSQPWGQKCIGLAKAAEQAVKCAAKNRVASIQASIPGQDKLEIELGNLQGNTLCYPESMEIPQTIAEQEAQFAELVEASKTVPMYQGIVNNPRNLTHIAKFPAMAGLELQGKDDVEEQDGEFELLLQSGPQPNPQIAVIQQQLQQIAQQVQSAEMDPEAQTPEGQQALAQLQDAEQQLQQQLQSLPPQVSSVPAAQDGSQDHAIHATITLDLMKTAEGRKLKNGSPEQQQIYQNLHLHWEEHVAMGQKLTPPKEIEFKGSLSVDPSKYAPPVQAKIFQAAGLQVAPEEIEGDQSLQPHEVTTEKEGVDANGVPVKQKISMVGKQLA
jgi:hypothetical protein